MLASSAFALFRRPRPWHHNSVKPAPDGVHAVGRIMTAHNRRHFSSCPPVRSRRRPCRALPPRKQQPGRRRSRSAPSCRSRPAAPSTSSAASFSIPCRVNSGRPSWWKIAAAPAAVSARQRSRKPTPTVTPLLINAAAHSGAPAAYPNLPYDAAADFSAVAIFGSVPNVLLVAPSKDIKSLQELVAKAKDGSMSFRFGRRRQRDPLGGRAFHRQRWSARRPMFRSAAGPKRLPKS